ncbi:hypothetical protein ACFQL4_17510 [Halosimplex aquaticum]
MIRDEGDPIPIPGGDEPPTERGCGVVVENEPIPGGTVEVSVYDDLKPAAAVPVWFGDRFVGRTDETGSVSGRAPYTREMNVTVEMPGADCEFYRRQYEDEAQSDVDPSGRASPLRSGFDPLDASPLALGGGAAGGESVAAQSTQATDGANDSSPYAVHGSVNVTVGGEPYPGETVLVLATVEHVPMRRASVSVDGERVGRTTANGTYELTVPRDQERVTVTVERGDFAGSTTVDVWLLDARVVPQEGLPFPGEPALVNATVGGPPVTDARVSLDGSRLGRTDEHGSLGLALPADPRQSVTVRTERQRASTSLWSAYLATITPSAFLLLVGIVGVPVTARTRGRGAARRAALVWTAVATMFVGLVVGEAFGLLVSTGVVLLGAALSNRQRVQSGVARWPSPCARSSRSSDGAPSRWRTGSRSRWTGCGRRSAASPHAWQRFRCPSAGSPRGSGAGSGGFPGASGRSPRPGSPSAAPSRRSSPSRSSPDSPGGSGRSGSSGRSSRCSSSSSRTGGGRARSRTERRAATATPDRPSGGGAVRRAGTTAARAGRSARSGGSSRGGCVPTRGASRRRGGVAGGRRAGLPRTARARPHRGVPRG